MTLTWQRLIESRSKYTFQGLELDEDADPVRTASVPNFSSTCAVA